MPRRVGEQNHGEAGTRPLGPDTDHRHAGVLAAPGGSVSARSLITGSPYPDHPVPVILRATAPVILGTDLRHGHRRGHRQRALRSRGRAVSRGQAPDHAEDRQPRPVDVWLPPSPLTITAAADGHADASRQVTTKPGSEVRADFALSAT